MCLLDVCCVAKWKIEKVTQATFKGGKWQTDGKDKIGESESLPTASTHFNVK